MYHSKFNEVKTLVEANINVLVVGEAGSGKSTLLKQVAGNLGYGFSFVTGTRQTTINTLLGFISINGTYIPSPLRIAYEEGKMFCLEELNGFDSNVLLVLNTLENGMLPFPDGYIEPPHENFRLVATANPLEEDHIYTGRNQLDGASLDRFDIIDVNRDDNLEVVLTDLETHRQVVKMRDVLSELNMSKKLSMRDCIRLYKRKKLGLAEGYIEKLLDNDELAIREYSPKPVVVIDEAVDAPIKPISSVEELWDSLTEQPFTQECMPPVGSEVYNEEL